MRFDTENINVGDKVIRHCGGMGGSVIGTVVKKTPSGLVDVKFGQREERYRKDGSRQKEGRWDHRWISYYSDEEGDRIKREGKAREMAYKISGCNFMDFRLEALELIWEVCEKEMQMGDDG